MFGLFSKKEKIWSLENDYPTGKMAEFEGETEGRVNSACIARNHMTGNATLTISFNTIDCDSVAVLIARSGRTIGHGDIAQGIVSGGQTIVCAQIGQDDGAKLADSQGIAITFIRDGEVIDSDLIPTKGHRLDICKAVSYK